MDIIAERIGRKLSDKKWRLSVAESCTGGLVSKLITDVAGSSQWFDRGFVTYTNEAKMAMLKVPQTILEKYGAVSLQTVEAMALGVLRNSPSEIALAISGVAGPGGGSEEKPVGMVCFAWADKMGESSSEIKQFSGDREAIRLKAAHYALKVLIRDFL